MKVEGIALTLAPAVIFCFLAGLVAFAAIVGVRRNIGPVAAPAHIGLSVEPAYPPFQIDSESTMRRSTMLSVFLVLALGALFRAPAQAAIIDVTVGAGGGLVFEPADVIINLGDTVRWTWESGGHNVGSGLPGDPTPFFLSGPPDQAGTSFEFLFDQSFIDANPVTGDLYAYHCHPHGNVGMIGSITVIPEPSSAWLAALPIFLIYRRVAFRRRQAL